MGHIYAYFWKKRKKKGGYNTEYSTRSPRARSTWECSNNRLVPNDFVAQIPSALPLALCYLSTLPILRGVVELKKMFVCLSLFSVLEREEKGKAVLIFPPPPHVMLSFMFYILNFLVGGGLDYLFLYFCISGPKKKYEKELTLISFLGFIFLNVR